MTRPESLASVRRYGVLHFTMQTRRSAMAHERLAYNVPDGVGIGWTPYRVKVTTERHTPYRAFDGAREFTRWLRAGGQRAVLTTRSRGLAYGTITERMATP